MDFTEFYQATSTRTLRYAYGLTGDLPQAQDVVQEAYTRAWQRWRQVHAYEDAEGWLRLVVSRLAVDWWRQVRLRRERPLPPPAPVDGPSEDTVLVVTALRALPARQRQAIALHYLLDVPVAQIATELDVSPGTVKSWLARGRDSLAALLRDDLPGVRLPGAEEIATRGRRRRRTRMVATVTAAGLAVLAVIVVATAVLGRSRTMPPPPAVTPTGSPALFSPLRPSGSFALPTVTTDETAVLDGRAYAFAFGPAGAQVTAVDVTRSRPLWPTVTVDAKAEPMIRTAVTQDDILLLAGNQTVALNAYNGRTRWRVTPAVDPESAVLFPGHLVYADREHGEIVGRELSMGDVSWRIPATGMIVGMVYPGDLGSGDPGNGSNLTSYAVDRMLLASGGTVTEYSAGSGRATGRSWHDVPAGDYLAYDGDLYISTGRTLDRLHLDDGRLTHMYAGGTLSAVTPCGPSGVCLIDAVDGQAPAVVALSGDHVRWRVPVPGARTLQAAGWGVRVELVAEPDAAVVLLDAEGRQLLRWTGNARLLRLDAGNLVGLRQTADRTAVDVIGVAAATGRQTPLGRITAPMTVCTLVWAGGMAVADRQLTVYRFD